MHTNTLLRSSLFPLGREFGTLPESFEAPSVVRPFGLQFAAPAAATETIDFAEITFDDDRQIALIRDGAALVPVAKHSTGSTSTSTSDGKGSMDSDTDHTED